MTIDIDQELAERYGAYASFSTQADPILVDSYGDDPKDEVDRLLAVFAKPESIILDLGCGGGHTLCALAPKVKAIWGFDQDLDLLHAARERVRQAAVKNATLVLGNVTVSEDIAQLPNDTFDMVLSRRGPNLNEDLLPKLKANAILIQELAQDSLGLKEIMGREPFLPQVGTNPHGLIDQYRWLGFIPVSVKDYFYDQYFRDSKHLAEYLGKGALLHHWRMPEFPYNESQDEAALALYARYNKTPKGIRLTGHRKVYLFRQTAVSQYPAYPEAQPAY